MSVEIRLARAWDAHLFQAVAEGVFDLPVDSIRLPEFLADPRHHIVIALSEGHIVGFASAVHYVHPDKAPELWINEVGVADAHQGRGIGKSLMAALLDHGRTLGCSAAWVLTDEDNAAARALYRSAGGTQSPCVMVEFDLETAAAVIPDTAKR